MNAANQTPTNWVLGNGEIVSIGDYVALDLGRDCVGRIVDVADDHTGRPVVMVTEGKGAGGRVPVWPAQMLLKVRR